jgi:hypothetical protein
VKPVLLKKTTVTSGSPTVMHTPFQKLTSV